MDSHQPGKGKYISAHGKFEVWTADISSAKQVLLLKSEAEWVQVHLWHPLPFSPQYLEWLGPCPTLHVSMAFKLTCLWKIQPLSGQLEFSRQGSTCAFPLFPPSTLIFVLSWLLNSEGSPAMCSALCQLSSDLSSIGCPTSVDCGSEVGMTCLEWICPSSRAFAMNLVVLRSHRLVEVMTFKTSSYSWWTAAVGKLATSLGYFATPARETFPDTPPYTDPRKPDLPCVGSSPFC